MKIAQLTNPKVDKEELVLLVNSILLYKIENKEKISKDLLQQIDNLPSKYIINNKLTETDANILYDVVRELWKNLCGQDIRNVDFKNLNKDIEILDGNYWMLPGEFMLGGFNHFSIAKKHRGMFCSLLGINQLIFERLICEDPKKLIEHIINHGGIRMSIDKSKNNVICQTSEASWPWARNKLIKMYHKNKTAKVIDFKTPYLGWESGVNIIIK